MTRVAPTHVRLERFSDERLARIVIDAGRGNVISGAVADEICGVLAEATHDTSLCALLFDHEGQDFSFGASVAEHLPGEVQTMLPRLHAAALALLRFPVPVIACVRGRCLGGGLELALCATLVFAAPTAVLAQPEIRLGVFAPLSSLVLPRLVGPSVAADLLLSGRSVSAEEALRLGLVHTLSADPTGAARGWVREHLALHSASSLRHALAALRGWRVDSIATELKSTEAAYLGRLMKTHDATEGIRAFQEKRAPRWSDR